MRRSATLVPWGGVGPAAGPAVAMQAPQRRLNSDDSNTFCRGEG